MSFMDWIADPEAWIALLTLTALEIVLGIDNIIFITILAGKLSPAQQPRARQWGLIGAMFTRIALLFSLVWLTRLTQPLLVALGEEISGRDLILIIGGLFLLAKSTVEIHDKLEGQEGHSSARGAANFPRPGIQIMLPVMVAAIVIAVGIMLFASKPIGDFVHHRPTIKILALSFLLLIGLSLVAEGLEFTIPKGYIYFAMGFSVFVEMLNLRLRERATAPVKLRERYTTEPAKRKATKRPATKKRAAS